MKVQDAVKGLDERSIRYSIGLIALLLFSISAYALPSVTWQGQTPVNNSLIATDYAELNVSIDNVADLNNVTFTWNGTSCTIYGSSLVLALNFNNNSAIGENATKFVDISMQNDTISRLWSPTIVPGYHGLGLHVNGSGESIRTQDKSDYLGNVTIMAWAKADTIMEDVGIIVSKWSYGITKTFYFGMSPNTVIVIVTHDGENFTTVKGNTTVTQTNWNHLAFTHDTVTNMTSVFLNGKLSNQSKTYSTLFEETRMYSIGAMETADLPYNGTIDDVRIYNRTLSSAEIAATYNSEFQRYNSTTYLFYDNLTNLVAGPQYNYSISANDSTGLNSTGTNNFYSICVNPWTGMNILANTNFCSGTWNLAAPDSTHAAINILGGYTLTGNNTIINGTDVGYGIEIKDNDLASIINLSISNYKYNIRGENSNGININNATLDNANYSAIFFSNDCNNARIINSRIENYTFFGIQADSSYYKRTNGNITITNNDFGFYLSNTLTGYDPQSMKISSTGTISNNRITNGDKGLYLQESQNLLVYNNTISNMTFNTDWYDVGIILVGHNYNITIDSNNITFVGTTGILIQNNESNIIIKNNYIDVVPIDQINGLGLYEQMSMVNEPPVGIAITPLSKTWISDGTEDESDTIINITQRGSHNIFIQNNIFGPNVQVPLRIQDNDNTTQDLTAYWYRKMQWPTNLSEPDEFYISNDYDYLQRYTGAGISGNIIQGYMNYYKLFANITKWNISFQNNASWQYNISLFSPNKYLIIGKQVTVESDRVNRTIPGMSVWEFTGNTIVDTVLGELFSANLSIKNSAKTVISISNLTAATQVNLSDCGHIVGSTWTLTDVDSKLGTTVSTKVAGADGCVNWSISSWSEHNETLDLNALSISWQEPTPENDSIVGKSFAEVNISINNVIDLNEVSVNWNGTSYNPFDSSLVLALNFNNNSAIGENATRVVDISLSNISFTTDSSNILNFTSGKYGKCIHINGSSGYPISNTPTTNISNSSKTIMMWVSQTIIGSQPLFQKGTTQNNQTMSVGFGSSGTKLRFCYFNSSLCGSYDSTTATGFTVNTWHHVAYVIDTTNKIITYYIDGVQLGTAVSFAASSMPIPDTDEPVYVGNGMIGSTFNGSIDELRIYNRTLSSNEVSLYYQSEFAKDNSVTYTLYANETDLRNYHTVNISVTDSSGTNSSLRSFYMQPPINITRVTGIAYVDSYKWYPDYTNNGVNDREVYFGATSNLPFVGDFDRDGTAGNVATFINFTKTVYYDDNFDGVYERNYTIAALNVNASPAAGDFDRDGYVDDTGYFNGSSWQMDHDSDGAIDNTISFGSSGSRPVAGDFDCDGFFDDCGYFNGTAMVYSYDCTGTTSTTSTGPAAGNTIFSGDFENDSCWNDIAWTNGTMFSFDYGHNSSVEFTLEYGSVGSKGTAGDFLSECDFVAYTRCRNNDKWWYDSCGNAVAIASACPCGCNTTTNDCNANTCGWGTTPPVVFTVATLKTKVFNWDTDRCETEDYPDVRARAFLDNNGNTNLFATQFRNYRAIGSTLSSVVHNCTIAYNSTRSSDPSTFNDTDVLESFYTFDGQTVYAIGSNDYYSNNYVGRCLTGSLEDCEYLGLSDFKSIDSGATFTKNATLIQYPVQQYSNWSASQNGFLDVSNIVYKDGYYYALVKAYRLYEYVHNSSGATENISGTLIRRSMTPQETGICLMRTNNVTSPNNWKVYNGSDYSITLTNPYTGDNNLSQSICPIINTLPDNAHGSLTWNTYLRKWMIVDCRYSASKYMSIFVSDDLFHWTDAQYIRVMPNDDTNWERYPSVIDDYVIEDGVSNQTRNFEKSDNRFYVYYTGYNSSNSNNRSLYRDAIVLSNITLSYAQPRTLFGNVTNTISSTSVNITDLGLSQNISIFIPVGEILSANLSIKNGTKTVISISNLTSATSANISDCGHTPGSVWTLTDVSTGGTTVTYKAVGIDGCINWTQSLSDHNLTLDAFNGTILVEITAPADNSTFLRNTTQAFYVNATGPYTDGYNVTVSWYNGSGSSLGWSMISGVSNNSNQEFLLVLNYPIGNYSYNASATNIIDNTTKFYSEHRNFTITNTLGNISVNLMGPPNGTSIIQNASANMTFNVTGPHINGYNVTVWWYNQTTGIWKESCGLSNTTNNTEQTCTSLLIPSNDYIIGRVYWNASAYYYLTPDVVFWSETRWFNITVTTTTTTIATTSTTTTTAATTTTLASSSGPGRQTYTTVPTTTTTILEEVNSTQTDPITITVRDVQGDPNKLYVSLAALIVMGLASLYYGGKVLGMMFS